MTQLAKTTTLLDFPSCSLSTTGLEIKRGLSFDEWARIGESIKKVEGARLWWLGDWHNYGEENLTETYTQALEQTDYEYGTLRNASSVARKFPLSCRHDSIPYAYYESLAFTKDLDKKDYDAILKKAAPDIKAKKTNVKKFRQDIKEYKLDKKNNAKPEPKLPPEIKLLQGDFREILAEFPDESVDLIFTDPPYDAESIPLYKDLAKHAARVLKPGASLITYSGHYAIPAILPLMSEHLRFWWVIAIKHHNQFTSLTGKKLYVCWKPLLWFVKGTNGTDEYVHDLVDSEPPNKESHEWAQSLKEAEYYISHLTEKDGLVLDPFAGSGTTLIAAHNLGRTAVGIEQNEERLTRAQYRIDEYLHPRLEAT